MKQVHHFYADKKEGRTLLYKQDIILWVEENIEHYEFIHASNHYSFLFIYGVKLFTAEDAMAFKLRWE